MKIFLICLLLGAAVFLVGISAHSGVVDSGNPALGLPPVPIPEDNQQTPEKIVLGKKLFEDKGGITYQLPAAEKEKWMKAAMPIKTNWIKDMKTKGLPGQAVLDYAEAQLSKTP